MDSENGLYNKYTVTKTETGESVTGFFLLRPDRDEHARTALWYYACDCRESNPKLSQDIINWLHAIERDLVLTIEGMTEEILENWISATDLPTLLDVYKTTSRNVFYVSFETVLSPTQMRQLSGLGFEVKSTAPPKNRYMLEWVSTPDDEL